MTWRPKPPSVTALTRAQYSGWACCWCSAPLDKGARSAGRAEGSSGAHDLSVEVYECGPHCPKRPQRRTPATHIQTPGDTGEHPHRDR